MATTRLVTNTNVQTNVNVTACVTSLDAQNTVQMDAILAAPPTGYLPGTLRMLGPMGMIFDGTNYQCWQSFMYETAI